MLVSSVFSVNDPSAPEISTLSLHDALPICAQAEKSTLQPNVPVESGSAGPLAAKPAPQLNAPAESRSAELASAPDRKSTRLNSSHRCISYAVFCLKKKTNAKPKTTRPESNY